MKIKIRKSIASKTVIAACLSCFLFLSHPTDSRKRYNLLYIQCNTKPRIVRENENRKAKNTLLIPFLTITRQFVNLFFQ